MAKKFHRVDPHLRIALGMEFPELPPGVTSETPGVADVRVRAGHETFKVYLDLEAASVQPQKIEVNVPEVLREAPWGEIVFNDNKPGALVSFGRQGEDKPFGPKEKGGYVFLRLYRELEHPFNPVYVRVDKGPEVRFFVLRARWDGGTITIDIERGPRGIPEFLID